MIGCISGNHSHPFIQEVTTTSKPNNTITSVAPLLLNQTTITNSTKVDEARGRALNFTLHDLNSSSTQKLDKYKDLSNVSMDDDDDDDEDIEDHDSSRVLTLKHFTGNGTLSNSIIFN